MKPNYGTLRAVQRTPDGEVVREHDQPVDSYVIGFVKVAAAVWGNQDVSGVTATDGSTYTLEKGSTAGNPFDWGTGTLATDEGILIGSDGTAETINDTALGSQLVTNISHASESVSTGSVSGSTATLTVTRTFTNNTGGSVTINEVGIVCEHNTTGSGIKQFLMLRDTGSPIDTVANGNNTTIEYQLDFEV